MHKLIITADDYGMCASVNRAIEACAAAGVVLSTNVMSNMDFAEDAAHFRKEYPYVSVGIHYNFTVGKPISPTSQVSSLVDENGYFLSYKQIREKCKEKTYLKREVEIEMKAQYDRYVSICGQPDYWNTHENVHVHPWLYQLFCDVNAQYGIMKMRTHRRIYIPSSTGKSDKSWKWMLTNPIKQVMLTHWKKNCERIGMNSPDGLLVRMKENDKLNLPYLFSHIDWRGDHVAEIAIHPALDASCEYFGEITDARIKEYEVFSNAEVLKTAKAKGLELASFEVVRGVTR